MIRRARLVAVGTGSDARVPSLVDVRIAEGRISQIAARVDPSGVDEVIDADGRWAIPGLWDAHVHLRQWALARTRIDLRGSESAAAVAATVGRVAAGLAPREAVIVGFGYRSATWPVPPSVAELDAVSGDHPAILTSGDAHNGWLNSAALRRLGIPARSGALVENEWFALAPAITALTAELADDAIEVQAAAAEAASRGIVGVTDFELAAGWRDWPERFARGVVQLRVRPAVYPDGLNEVIKDGLSTGDRLPGTGGLVTMGPLKIISDGSLNTRTAHCRHPYADAEGREHPSGVQNYDLATLLALLRKARNHGLEVALHAIGDAAVGIALDAFAATGARGGVEHAQLICRSDIARMAALGLRASVQPAHLLDDRDVTARCWPDRADRCFPFHSLLDAGVELALGSDAPVAPLDPWLAMAAAVHRSADQREPWNAAESLTAAQALAASTDGQPTLHVGGRGDVVLLDADPLADSGATADAGDVPSSAAVAARLREMRVAATILAGRPTYLDL